MNLISVPFWSSQHLFAHLKTFAIELLARVKMKFNSLQQKDRPQTPSQSSDEVEGGGQEKGNGAIPPVKRQRS